MLRQALSLVAICAALGGCASRQGPPVGPVTIEPPPGRVEVAPFIHYACSVCAVGLKDDRRALRELGIAAELAPDDPYLAARWRAARRRAKAKK